MYERRYDRQILFRDFSEKDQRALTLSKIAVIGVGATGSNTSELLARAGVGFIFLADHDKVDITNLQRQNLFSEKDIGKNKARCAKSRLSEINSSINIDFTEDNITDRNINLLKYMDLIIDCTDDFGTRYILNNFCIKNRIPWIYSAVAGSRGSVMHIIPDKTPCFSCIFDNKESNVGSATEGILNSAVVTSAGIATVKAIKCLTKKDQPSVLTVFDVWNHTMDNIKVSKRKDCPVCGKKE